MTGPRRPPSPWRAPDAALHAAASDCEHVRPGPIGQPVNTLSSLAFVAAAVPIARAAVRRRRPAWRAVAVAAAFEGLGSAAYHGPGGRRAKQLHDVGIVVLATTMVGARVADRPPLPLPPVAATLGAVAVGVHALSRTGGPLCACRSPFQGHAAFHLLTAAALVAAAHDR